MDFGGGVGFNAGMNDYWIYIFAAVITAFVIYRTIRGRTRFRVLKRDLEAEGILMEQSFVMTGFSFPMIKKLTFADIFLSRRRFVVTHWLTANMILQAPLGAEGAAGTEKGRFEVEETDRGGRLLLRTTLRGGGKVRFRLDDPEAWLQGIRDNQ